jgi:cellulose synthase/poly-beta-1,6-N-acetylglucosamine synthase-like glycosyltransferase
MPYSSLFIEALFLVAVTLIWFMLGYQSLLFFMGHRYYRRTRHNPRVEPPVADADLPAITFMLPCRNEERVIEHTIRALQNLDYPAAKMEFLIINDGSTDNTGGVVRAMGTDPRVRLLDVPADRAAKGKAAALNFALAYASHDVLAIYDADNMPEPGAVRPLASQMVREPHLAATVGMYRAWNRHRSLLTRFLNIEGIGFQWIFQAGRSMLMRLTMLPGTNYLIRRPVLEKVGGWDVLALTEDAELTVRIYRAGFEIRFVPDSVSWEQEPEHLGNWFRQRRRWVRGNNYVLRKWGSSLLRRDRISLEMLYSLVLYYLFFLAVVISDLVLLLNITGVIAVNLPGPYTIVWIVAYATFVLQLAIVLSCEPGEHSAGNILLTFLMYFTYCQFWIPVVAAAVYDDLIARREIRWAKTERYRMDSTLR